MKNLLSVALALGVTFTLASGAKSNAATVGASGYTNDFSTQPAAADFSTRAFGSTTQTGAGEVTTAAGLDAAATTNSAALITSQCASATGTPPSAASLAVWASAGGYLQTRPTQNGVTLLMATLVNGTGSDGTGARLIYEYTTNRAAVSAEQVSGLRAYYSLSGAANSWTVIPALSQTAQGALDVTLELSGGWTNGGALYLLWADDNGSPSPDDAINIDNFFVEVTGTSAATRLVSPSNGQSLPDTNAVTFSASASAGPGATVTGVGFYETSSGLIGSAYSAPYTIAANIAPGSFNAYAVSTNSAGQTVYSGTNSFTVFNVPFSATLTTPTNGTTHGTPTNVTLAATAYGGKTATITGVAFHEATSGFIASATTAPYSASANFGIGTHRLYVVATNSQGATVASSTNTLLINAVTNTTAPAIFSVNPPHSTPVSNLTSVTVTFTEAVTGVNASDLLVNGAPATGLTGSGSNYVFTFPQPPYGQPAFSWAANHGITDFGWPSQLPFDANGEGANWGYYLLDQAPPTITSRSPAAGTTVTNATQISVTFSEAVTGVDAGDLLVNGIPASSVAGSGSNYTFSATQPSLSNGPLAVAVTWAANHGITDTAATPNAFNRTNGGWNFTLDIRTILISSNALWHFAKGTNEASNPTNAWRQISFDDSNWSNAPAPFFYGDPYSNGAPAYTHLTDMQSNYSSIYLRKEFQMKGASFATNVLLTLQADDGAVVWLNGVEVLRYNAPAGEVGYRGLAPISPAEPNGAGVAYVTYTLTNGAAAALVEGRNVLAIHALNQSLASGDFGFNAQLFTYVPDFSSIAPRLASTTPTPGEIQALTSVSATFSEAVTGVSATDLLINGIPATSVSSPSAETYIFTFPQPAFGPVTVTWAQNHGIADTDTPPKPFNGEAAGATLRYSLVNPAAPVVASHTPATGTSVTTLNMASVTFSQPVTGVDAGDLLVNGAPAAQVSGNGADYTFSFAQPAYGNVAITWADNSGIQDSSGNTFDGARMTNTWSFTLLDQTPPLVASKIPAGGTFVAGLTQITINFSEAVSGVNAGDLLVNGRPATGVTGSGTSYTFTFPQPNATGVTVSWAANHGIKDLATTPNSFNSGSAGATWSYTTTDTVAPSIEVNPPPYATVKNLTALKIQFDELVTGVNASDLLINGAPAQGLTGTGAGPYTFTFTRPATGAVQVAFALAHGIQDAASPPNAFGGGSWSYTLNPAIPTDIAVSHVVQISLDGLAAVHLQFYTTNAPEQFPTFVRLMNEGAYTMNARCDYDISETVPNHTTMFTGRPVMQPAGLPNTTHHGYNNNFPTASETIHNSGNTNVPYKFSMFDMAHDYGLTTAFYAGKTRLDICDRSYNDANGALDLIGADNGRDKIDFSSVLDIQGAAISNEVNAVVADLTSAAPKQYIFIHIAEPDLTGHSASWGTAAWSNIVRAVDAQLGRIIEAIDSNPALANQTALIVTADHGGGGVTANAHTEAYHINNYTIPFFVRAPGIAAGTDIYELFSNRTNPGTNRTDYTTQPQPMRNGDASNLALSLLALPPIPGSFMVPAFATPQVTLRTARFQGQLSLFWADVNDEYDLQTADVLNAAQWQTIGSGIVTNETTKVYTIANVNAAAKQFFRLKKR